MMENLSEVQKKLMLPQKELASWKFPLGQTVEQYFSSLPEISEIHFGEAALIIQNSVNAYARKVEDLYERTQAFTSKVVKERDAQEEQGNKEKRQNKRSFFDFSQNEDISKNFDKELGKNLTLKNEMKPLKYLHQCFSQFTRQNENTSIENCFKVKVCINDVEGEVVGKKYDFRCSQRMTKNGRLVQEFSHKDFEFQEEQIFDGSNHVDVNCDSPTVHENIERDTIFDQHLAGESDVNCQSPSSENIEGDAICDQHIVVESDVNCQSPSSVQDSGYFSAQQIESPSTDVEHGATDSHGKCTNENHITDDSVCDDQGNEEDQVEIIENVTETVSICDDDDIEDRNREMLENPVNENNSINTEQLDTFEKHISDHEAQNNVSDSNANEIVTSKRKSETIEGPNAAGDLINVKRSKRIEERLSKMSKTVNISEKSLNPIPFDNGIPDKQKKSRAEFRMPCNIALLKKAPAPRRRSQRRTPKKRVLSPPEDADEEIALNNLNSRKMTVFSPSRPQISIKDENVSGFQKPLEEILNYYSKQCQFGNYEPVMTESMDLLGFAPNYGRNNNIEQASLGSSDSRSNSPLSFTPPHTPPRTPVSLSNLISPSNIKLSLSAKKRNSYESSSTSEDLKNIVDNKIKEIYEELDVKTEEDERITKWHEQLKPMLKKVEKRQKEEPFVMEKYEEKIKQKLKRLNRRERRLSFEDIVKEEPESEVARLFSATLQLASHNNVNIRPVRDPSPTIEVILIE